MALIVLLYCNCIVFTLIVLTAAASTVNEEEVKDVRCLNLDNYPAVDMEWFSSIDKWYYPMWSRLDLYRGIADLLKVPVNEIPYATLSKSCLTSDKSFVFSGVGRKAPLFVSFDAQGVLHYKGKYYPLGGKARIAMTDNKSYVVGIVCWEDNEAAYNVWTTTPGPLPDSIKGEILGYLELVGFDLKHFIETPCSAEFEDGSYTKAEL